MKGFISRTAMAASLVSAIVVLSGCYGYKDVVDPCYPWRYNWAAQQEVCEPLAIQVNNGHVLDQTVWTSDFERGRAVLTRSGEDHLLTLLRRRPHPDPVVYLATATVGSSETNDVMYSLGRAPEVVSQDREKLNQDRIQAIQHYLAAQTAGRNLSFQVYVHDPAQPYVKTGQMARSITQMGMQFKGSLAGGAGGGGGGAGATPP